MKRGRFTESQIVGILKQYDAGKTTEAICRECKIRKATFYSWRKKYVGMETPQLKRLKALEDENNRLKLMYSDLSPDHQLLKEVLEKKVLAPSERKLQAEYLIEEKQVNEHRACRVVNLSRSQWHYQSKRDDTEVINSLEKLAQYLPIRGFDEYSRRIRTEGRKWNQKRILRVYRKLNLVMRRKRKRRLPDRVKQPLVQPTSINHTWSMDIMHDSLEYGRKIRVLNIIDDCNREALAIEPAYWHSAESVAAELEELIWTKGKPLALRTDNGPEFISKCLSTWCKERNIEMKYIQPGEPTQNAYIERFNRLFREDVLDAYVFEDLKQVKQLAEEWKNDYNLNHPHSSLGGLSPKNYLRKLNLNLST